MDTSIPDMTDITIIDKNGSTIFQKVLGVCIGKPVFSKGCFVVYQDNDDDSLYRVISFRNEFRFTEFHMNGKAEVFSVDPESRGIFIRSDENIFYIPSDIQQKELILNSNSQDNLKEKISAIKGYNHVFKSRLDGELYVLCLANDNYDQKILRIWS